MPVLTEEVVHDSSENKAEFVINEARTIAVAKCSEWYDVDSAAKQAYMDEMKEMYKLYKGDHWDLVGPTGRVLRTKADQLKHANNVEPITFALIEGLVAEFSQDIKIVDFPVEREDEKTAKTFTDLKDFIAYKNRLQRERTRWCRWFFLYGTGIWQTYWDPDWSGGSGPNRWQGDIRWLAVHPEAFFPDARAVTNINDGRRCHKGVYLPIEDVEERYPDAKITPDSIMDDRLVATVDDEYSTGIDIEQDQVYVVETWYRGKPLMTEDGDEDQGYGLHVVWWAGEGNQVYLDHANYVYFEPEQDVEFPFHVAQCYPREGSVFGYGEAFFLKNPQIMLNKHAEMITEGHIHHSMGQTFYDASALTEPQKLEIKKNGTIPNMYFEVNDINKIKKEYGQGVPQSLVGETARIKTVMETIVGRFDISQGKTPSNITAFRALDLLASRAQVRLTTKEQSMHVSHEDCGNYINRLINQNYTERRKYRILGDDSKASYSTFNAQDHQKAYIYEMDKSVPLSYMQEVTQGQEALPPEEQMLEGRDYEVYSPELDTRCKISTTLPTDRVFYMEMAKELYSNQMIELDVFFYVIENGKFPPWEDLEEDYKLKKQQQMEQEQMQQQMMMQQQQMQMQQEQGNNPQEAEQQVNADQVRASLLKLVSNSASAA